MGIAYKYPEQTKKALYELVEEERHRTGKSITAIADDLHVNNIVDAPSSSIVSMYFRYKKRMKQMNDIVANQQNDVIESHPVVTETPAIRSVDCNAIHVGLENLINDYQRLLAENKSFSETLDAKVKYIRELESEVEMLKGFRDKYAEMSKIFRRVSDDVQEVEDKKVFQLEPNGNLRRIK